jgi:hypothetical protein
LVVSSASGLPVCSAGEGSDPVCTQIFELLGIIQCRQTTKKNLLEKIAAVRFQLEKLQAIGPATQAGDDDNMVCEHERKLHELEKLQLNNTSIELLIKECKDEIQVSVRFCFYQSNFILQTYRTTSALPRMCRTLQFKVMKSLLLELS